MQCLLAQNIEHRKYNQMEFAMETPSYPSSLEASKQYIYSIDFSAIINKMVLQDGWQKENAYALSELYKNYLFLIRKFGEQYPTLPPSQEIDLFWHNHILDTTKYLQDCQAIFGKFLHHNPYFLGLDSDEKDWDVINAFETVQQLHFAEFGTFIYKIKKRSFLYSCRLVFVKLAPWQERQLMLDRRI